MDAHYWADWAVIAQAALAFFAAIVAYWQITSSQDENRKWKTLEICAQHELAEPLSSAVDRLRKYYDAVPRPDFKTVDYDITTVLNYLDAIAIGVEQGLYIESLAKDHLRDIVRIHLHEAFEKNGDLAGKRYFLRLIDMDHKWQRDKPYYQATVFRFARITAHPIVITLLTLAIAASVIWVAIRQSGGEHIPVTATVVTVPSSNISH